MRLFEVVPHIMLGEARTQELSESFRNWLN